MGMGLWRLVCTLAVAGTGGPADNVLDELEALVDQLAEQNRSKRILQRALGDAQLHPLQGGAPPDPLQQVRRLVMPTLVIVIRTERFPVACRVHPWGALRFLSVETQSFSCRVALSALASCLAGPGHGGAAEYRVRVEEVLGGDGAVGAHGERTQRGGPRATRHPGDERAAAPAGAHVRQA
eukprot:9482428-Pyramimonas_sp.AAC.3